MIVAVDWLIALYQGLLFSSPAFLANTVAVYTSGFGRVDFGKNFIDGKPILGSHKTIGGFLGGTISGAVLGITVPLYFPEITNQVVGYKWWIGIILGFGALLGDSIGSFFKRRVALKPGGAFPIMDQIGFIATAFLLAWFFVKFPPLWAWTVIPATLIIHLGANSIAYVFGWKDVPW